MAEETKKQENKEEKIEEKENIAEQPEKEIKEEKETETKKEKKKTEEKKPKTEAVVNAKDLPISTKHSIAICDFIRWKKAEEAALLLQEVVRMKRAIPMKGELPHRKGNIERGRYPVKAAQQFIKLLKQLAANAVVNEIDLENTRIECKANRASRPYKKSGRMRAKRTHVTLRLAIKSKKQNKK